MPGVVVETYTYPGPGENLFALGATFFVAGLTERGDAEGAVLVTSMNDFIDQFGEYVSYGSVYDAVATYFAEGGVRAYIARVVGPSATKGTLALVDRAESEAPTTLTVTAKHPGAWSADVKIQVEDGDVSDTFKITVYHQDEIVEVYNNLPDPATAVTEMAASSFVTVANNSSTTTAPNNNPKTIDATVLSTGTDDRGSLTASSYVTALARFNAELGPGRVAIPGFPSSQVGDGLIAHATDRRRIALLATASGQTPAQAKAAALEFHGDAGTEHAGLFYPWVKVPDGAGGLRLVSPEGYVAGVSARAHVQEGPWRAPAGEIAIAKYVRELERDLTRTEGDDLNDKKVNAIRTITSRIRLYGWRSLSTDTLNYRLLTGRDVMNEVAGLGERKLEKFVFGTVDGRGHFQKKLEDEMCSILEPMRSAGGLYERINHENGELIDAGYTVDAGPGVNTPDRLARDEVAVDVRLRVSPSAELIRLRITKVSFQSAL